MLPHQQYVSCIFEAQGPQQQPFSLCEYFRINNHHRFQRAE
jgi:hypothetical protein